MLATERRNVDAQETVKGKKVEMCTPLVEDAMSDRKETTVTRKETKWGLVSRVLKTSTWIRGLLYEALLNRKCR